MCNKKRRDANEQTEKKIKCDYIIQLFFFFFVPKIIFYLLRYRLAWILKQVKRKKKTFLFSIWLSVETRDFQFQQPFFISNCVNAFLLFVIFCSSFNPNWNCWLWKCEIAIKFPPFRTFAFRFYFQFSFWIACKWKFCRCDSCVTLNYI